jgi:hypothetical protein
MLASTRSKLDWELEFIVGESTIDDGGARDIRGRAFNIKKNQQVQANHSVATPSSFGHRRCLWRTLLQWRMTAKRQKGATSYRRMLKKAPKILKLTTKSMVWSTQTMVVGDEHTGQKSGDGR